MKYRSNVLLIFSYYYDFYQDFEKKYKNFYLVKVKMQLSKKDNCIFFCDLDRIQTYLNFPCKHWVFLSLVFIC